METNFDGFELPPYLLTEIEDLAVTVARSVVYASTNPERAEVWFSEAAAMSYRAQTIIRCLPNADEVRGSYRSRVQTELDSYAALFNQS